MTEVYHAIQGAHAGFLRSLAWTTGHYVVETEPAPSPYVGVQRSTGQSVASGGDGSFIEWEANLENSIGAQPGLETADWWTSGTYLVVPSGRSGLYLATVDVSLGGTGAQVAFQTQRPDYGGIGVDAGSRTRGTFVPLKVSDRFYATECVVLKEGDYVSVRAVQSSGSPQNVTGRLRLTQVSALSAVLS